MSNLLSQASLVMIPSGYKEDTVYSVVPSDGSGDLSFTRASNGTRVNSAGLVEVCPWNLLEQSGNFNVSPWSNTNVTLTSGQTDPNGGTNAFRAQYSGVAYLYQILTAFNGINSIYAKAYGSSAKIRMCDPNGSFATQYNLTNEWQRITTSGNGLIGISIDSFIDGSWTSQDIVIAFAQSNIGSTAKPYFPTTDRLNVPRLTYQNGGGGCPSLLLEKQSTNLCLYSEDFSNGNWTKSGFAITANAAISPDGTQNADLVYQTVSGDKDLHQTTSSVTPTFSIYAKAAGKNWVVTFDAVGGSPTWYNISNGTLGTVGSGVTATIEGVGNGWYRLTYYSNTAGIYRFVKPVDSNNSQSATASGTDGAYFWGAQVEASSYATSYIPTQASSATRVADACSKTGISSLIGQTEGVLFADITPQIFNDSAYQTVAIIYPSAGLGGTYFHFYKNLGTKTLFFEVWNATSQCSLSYTMANNTRYKVAAGYKNNDFVLYVNGVQVGSDTSGTVGSVSYSTLEMGYDSFNTDSQMSLSEFVLFPTRLSNSELASITSL